VRLSFSFVRITHLLKRRFHTKLSIAILQLSIFQNPKSIFRFCFYNYPTVVAAIGFRQCSAGSFESLGWERGLLVVGCTSQSLSGFRSETRFACDFGILCILLLVFVWCLIEFRQCFWCFYDLLFVFVLLLANRCCGFVCWSNIELSPISGLRFVN
jgi:hypothetical protein